MAMLLKTVDYIQTKKQENCRRTTKTVDTRNTFFG